MERPMKKDVQKPKTKKNPQQPPPRSPAERMAQAASAGLLLGPNDPEFADL
jgi:hypothetical protein